MAVTKSFIRILALLLSLGCVVRAEDAILTLPFENVSGRGEYHWIGESFVVLYGEMLETPGMRVSGLEERHLAYEKLSLKVTDLLTRAAVIRLADAAGANLALVGTYDIGGSDPKSATIAISARLIETAAGRLIGNKVFNFSGPLSELQAMQGQLAWHILYERNPSLPYSKDQFVRSAQTVPPRAWESYVKGIQTQDPKLRESFLRRAIQEYQIGGAGGEGKRYAQAIHELGLLFYRQRNFTEALPQFKQLEPGDACYQQGLFQLGIAAYEVGNLPEAATAFDRLAELAPLPEVLNNAGALLFAKGDGERALSFLQRAVTQVPREPAYRFNYGYVLWRTGNFAEAAQHLKLVVDAAPRDGEALFLLARSLEGAGNAAEATRVDDEAKRHFNNYARWAVAPERIPHPLRLKREFNRAALLKLERRQQGAPAVTPQSLDRVRQLVATNKDAEAAPELQRILAADNTQSEAHYLLGIIHHRRGEAEKAVGAYQAAIYWNPRHVAAHVVLGRIFLARGDRALALTHARQALEVEPQHRDALALKQQIETGR